MRFAEKIVNDDFSGIFLKAGEEETIVCFANREKILGKGSRLWLFSAERAETEVGTGADNKSFSPIATAIVIKQPDRRWCGGEKDFSG